MKVPACSFDNLFEFIFPERKRNRRRERKTHANLNKPYFTLCSPLWSIYGNSIFVVDIDECPSMPCDNGGVCTNMPGSFSCDCTGTGYEGATCITGRFLLVYLLHLGSDEVWK